MCLLPLGGCFDNPKNKNIGLQRTVNLANAGNVDAQYNLGVLYGRGAWKHFDVPQDYAEAVKWLRLAAEQGHANAQFDLGKLYLHGFDVPEDYAEAYVWFSVAAADGHADAAGLRDLAYSQLKAVQITLGQKRVAELLKKFGSGKQPEPPVTVDNSAPNKTNGPTSVELPESTNSIGMEFKLIPAGTFTMGDASGDDDETPHEVTLAQPFKMGVHEVTQAQYEQVMGVNNSRFIGANNPVERVSWDDAVEFCRRLSDLPAEKAAGNVYRLPTEAEWEYACRAGTTTKYSFGDDESELEQYGWCYANSGENTHPVGSKQPNAWGLYGMQGNVAEWCQDWYGDYPSGSVTDPTGPVEGSFRVYRGGSWLNTAEGCRSAFRYWNLPSGLAFDLGFRVCLSPSGK
ncbi:SUMF1/EgtB/PvdO family nonheme iron enzyme [bacterium]|nr:SUMF1/EgtB/PvdO family nonheme iron enzyme [bacterium]